MADAAATADNTGSDTHRMPQVGPWQLASVLVVVAGIVAVFALGLSKFDSDKDTMTGVLGVVVPAFATIGAAVFGVTVGYNAGRSAGEATGKAKGEADKVQAVADARKSLATEVLGHLRDAQAPVEELVSTVAQAGSSDAGVQSFRLGSGDGSVEVATDTLHGASKGVEKAITACETALHV